MKTVRVKVANQVLVKIEPVLVSIEGVLAKPEIALVSQVIREPIDTAKAQLEEIRDRCNAIVAGGDGEPGDVKTVAALVANVRKQIALACQVLASVARASANKF